MFNALGWRQFACIKKHVQYLPQRHTGHTAVHRIVNAGNFIIITGEPLLFQCQRRADDRTYNSLSTLCLSRHRRKREYVPLFVLIFVKWFEIWRVSECGQYIYIYIDFYVCIHIFIYMYANNSIRHRFHFVTSNFSMTSGHPILRMCPWYRQPRVGDKDPPPHFLYEMREVRFCERANETYMNWKGDESRFLLLMMRGW